MANIIISKNDYKNEKALKNIVNYIIQDSKCFGIYGGQGVLLDKPHTYMETIKNYYCQNNSKQAQHFWLTFDTNEYISPNDAYVIGYAVCRLFPEYQIIFGFHQDTIHPHIHWAINPVNILNGKKFNFGYAESFELRKRIADILKPYNYRCNLRMPSEII